MKCKKVKLYNLSESVLLWQVNFLSIKLLLIFKITLLNSLTIMSGFQAFHPSCFLTFQPQTLNKNFRGLAKQKENISVTFQKYI